MMASNVCKLGALYTAKIFSTTSLRSNGSSSQSNC